MSQKPLNIIKDIAIKAGDIALSHQKELSKLKIKEKGLGDFVSQADTECEKFIKDELNKHFEGFSFLAEESGKEKKDSPYTWIIDPIDGTTNFLKGMKSYSCCICLQEKGKTIASVVYFPALDELYYASRDKDGAYLELPHTENSKAIKLDCSNKVDLESSLISYGLGNKCFDMTSNIMRKLSPVSGGIRSLGSCSLDIIKVAKGEFGAYIKSSIQSWDLYPAGYIAEKAGAEIYDIIGTKIQNTENYSPEEDGCIITNKHLIEGIKEMTKPNIDKTIETAKEVYNDKICPLANKAVKTSTPYVKDAYKKSGPFLQRVWANIKIGYQKAKPVVIKAYQTAKPYVIKFVIWLKDALVKIVKKLAEMIKSKTKK